MNDLKKILAVVTGGLLAMSPFAVDAAARPLHVLYLGSTDGSTSGGPGFGRGRTDYVYLPGQTLAPEAIYFDYIRDSADLTAACLKHFDAVVQVMPDSGIPEDHQKLLNQFKSAGNPVIHYPDGIRPKDADLRESVLRHVSQKVRLEWEALIAQRPALERQPGECPTMNVVPSPFSFRLHSVPWTACAIHRSQPILNSNCSPQSLKW